MRKQMKKLFIFLLVFFLSFGSAVVTPQIGGESVVYAASKTSKKTKSSTKAKISQKKATMIVGQSLQLSLEGASGKVKWSSSNKKVATVSKGVVKAKKAGKATITAKVGKKKYKCKVKVKIGLSDSSVTLTKGNQKQIKLMGTKAKSYTSSNPAVATVTKKGLIQAVGVGNAVITAKGKNKKKYKCNVTVEDIPQPVVENPQLSETSLTVYYKQSKTLTVTGTSKDVQWSTSNKKIATVDNNGNVTGVNIGTATVTAKIEDTSLTCDVTVSYDPNKTYTVTFDSNGGTPTPAAQKVKEGNTATEPANPSNRPKRFDGWYNGNTVYDFSKPVLGNLNLVAKWSTVTDNLNDDVIDLGDIIELESQGLIDVQYDENGVVGSIDGKFTNKTVTDAASAAAVIEQSKKIIAGNNESIEIDANNISVKTVSSAAGTEKYFKLSQQKNGVDVIGSEVVIMAKSGSGEVTGMHNSFDSRINDAGGYSSDEPSSSDNEAAINAVMNGAELNEYLESVASANEGVTVDKLKEDLRTTLKTEHLRNVIIKKDETTKPRFVHEILVYTDTDDASLNSDGEEGVSFETLNSDDEIVESVSDGNAFEEGAVEDAQTEDPEAIVTDGNASDEASENNLVLTSELLAEGMVVDEAPVEDNLDGAVSDGNAEVTEEGAAAAEDVQPEESANDLLPLNSEDDPMNDGLMADDEETPVDTSNIVLPEIYTRVYVLGNSSNSSEGDGSTGSVWFMIDETEGAWNAGTLTTDDHKHRARTINVEKDGTKNRLKDTVRKITTYEAINKSFFGYQWSKLPGQLNETVLVDETATSAHANMEVVYDFYKNVLGRNSYDGNGAAITVSYNGIYSGFSDNDMANAYWTSAKQQFVFGNKKHYADALDVIGHEFTHAVVGYIVGDGHRTTLTYQGESGALNEAYADIMGTLIENKSGDARWLLAEDSDAASGKPNGAIRSMANPTAYGDPDHYTRRYTGSDDNGGVHTNSSIFNRAAYLMMTNGNTSTISRDTWAKIFYNSLYQLSCDSSFLDARRAVIISAKRMGVNGGALQAIKQAFDTVGIVERNVVHIRLIWGETPRDLDSHLVKIKSDGSNDWHIYYSHKKENDSTGKPVADLDYDDTTSFGPENTTIYDMTPGVYYFFVHDYSDGNNANCEKMAASGATVQVSKAGEHLRTYHISPSSKGTIWEVCRIEIAQDGSVRIQDKNIYSGGGVSYPASITLNSDDGEATEAAVTNDDEELIRSVLEEIEGSEKE